MIVIDIFSFFKYILAQFTKNYWHFYKNLLSTTYIILIHNLCMLVLYKVNKNLQYLVNI